MGNGIGMAAPADQLADMLSQRGRVLSAEAIAVLRDRDKSDDFSPEEIEFSLARATDVIASRTDYGQEIDAALIRDFLRDLCPDFPPFC